LRCHGPSSKVPFALPYISASATLVPDIPLVCRNATAQTNRSNGQTPAMAKELIVLRTLQKTKRCNYGGNDL